MNTTTYKQISLVLGYTIVLSNSVLVLSGFNFTWFLITCATIALNVIFGIIGGCLLHSKFFKREMTRENFGLWTAIVFAGPIVLLFGLIQKPPNYPAH